MSNPSTPSDFRPHPSSLPLIPYRLALAGGWIDQPFISKLNPSPPGSMVVISLEPREEFMERAGMATGTRKVARTIWNNHIPDRPPADLVRELYAAENMGKPDPSGSQDMIGLIYPGVCRLDYDASYEGGYFPIHIEQNCDRDVADWLENVIHMMPLAPRPAGYHPLGEMNLDAALIQRLGQTGRDCYDAIINKDTSQLGASMNDCMACWSALLPNTVRHEVIKVDIEGTLRNYQERYPGAMCSGCGGGYIVIASEEPVPETSTIKVRLS